MSLTDLAVLGLLSEQDLHGYELQKRLADLSGTRVSFGSLYPALSRLEREGAVRAVDDVTGTGTAPLPATGSLAGETAAFRAALRQVRRGRRGRKVYGITDAGRARLAELLEAPADDDRAFPLQLTFLHLLPTSGRTRILERRRAQLAERLAAVEARPLDRTATRWRRALAAHEAESLARDLAWVDGLIAGAAESPEPAASVESATEPAGAVRPDTVTTNGGTTA